VFWGTRRPRVEVVDWGFNILLLLSGDAKDKWINVHIILCPTMKILLKLTSTQCGLPSLSTMEHPTKLPKDFETFYKRPRNQPI
jgi:hypothetical protein